MKTVNWWLAVTTHSGKLITTFLPVGHPLHPDTPLSDIVYKPERVE